MARHPTSSAGPTIHAGARKRARQPRETAGATRAVRETRVPAAYVLRLFVAGNTMTSQRAITQLRAICEQRLRGRYQLEVIDIYQEPGRLPAAQIVAAPTLLKDLPLPLRRLVGDLSDKQRVLIGLDLVPRGAQGS